MEAIPEFNAVELSSDLGIWVGVFAVTVAVTAAVTVTVATLCRSCGFSLLSERVASKSLCIMLICIGVYFAFAAVGINIASAALSLGLVAFTISRVLTEVLSDIVYGIRILMSKIYRENETVMIGEDRYVVDKLGWVHVILRVADTGQYRTDSVVMGNRAFYDAKVRSVRS